MKKKYSQQEVKKLLGISRQMIWKYENDGLLTSQKAGRNKFYLNDKKLQQLLSKKNKVNLFENHEKRIEELEKQVAFLTERLNSLPIIDQINVNKMSDNLHVGQANVNKKSNSLYNETVAKMKATIEKAIEKGIHKSKINIKGKGSQLGKWLKGESLPSFEKIEKWYKKAIEIMEAKK